MNSEIHAKLLTDLTKSGFASEMAAIRAIQDAGWQGSGTGAYFDRDQHITRTIDIRAYQLRRDWNAGAGGIDFEYQLFAEVKKSERPWVVFRQKEQHKGVGDGWHNPYLNFNEACPASTLSSQLRQNSIRHNLGWMGYGVHEAFKEPQDSGRWYAAAVTACKAAYDYVRHDCFKNFEKHEKKQTFLIITQPIVIIDGPLISAELGKNQEIELEEISYAPFEFEFGTEQYDSANYRVDLVRLSSLPEYLEIHKRRIDSVFSVVQKAKSSTKAAPF